MAGWEHTIGGDGVVTHLDGCILGKRVFKMSLIVHDNNSNHAWEMTRNEFQPQREGTCLPFDLVSAQMLLRHIRRAESVAVLAGMMQST